MLFIQILLAILDNYALVALRNLLASKVIHLIAGNTFGGDNLCHASGLTLEHKLQALSCGST